jgi:hypothetical protein
MPQQPNHAKHVTRHYPGAKCQARCRDTEKLYAIVYDCRVISGRGYWHISKKEAWKQAYLRLQRSE